jgi:hypothetical protein
MEILNKIVEYNNKKCIEANNCLNIKKNYNINLNLDIIELSDNNKKVLTGEYIFCGIFVPETSTWVWSNNIIGTNKSQIKIINQIKNKNYLFENSDNEKVAFIYQFLCNDSIRIEKMNDDLMYLINRTLNYLTNSLMVINPVNSSNNIQFIAINKIIERYF